MKLSDIYGRLFDTTFVPVAEADEYVSILMSLLGEYKAYKPMLEVYSPLKDEVWE